MFTLPEATEQGIVSGLLVELPQPTTKLPREKPLPQPKPPTRCGARACAPPHARGAQSPTGARGRWEKFAKEKGIKKRKRGKNEWDDSRQEWRPRHGFESINDQSDVPIIEAKSWERTGAEDPFTLQSREKKTRVKAQEGRQVKNLQAAKRQGARLPPTVALSSSLTLDGRGGAPLGARMGRNELKASAGLVRSATASMGKFDRKIEGHKDERPAGKRRKFLPVVAAKKGGANPEKVCGLPRTGQPAPRALWAAVARGTGVQGEPGLSMCCAACAGRYCCSA